MGRETPEPRGAQVQLQVNKTFATLLRAAKKQRGAEKDIVLKATPHTTANHENLEFPRSWRTYKALLVPADLPWFLTSEPQTGIQSVSCFKLTACSLSSSRTGGNRPEGPALCAEARVLNAHLFCYMWVLGLPQPRLAGSQARSRQKPVLFSMSYLPWGTDCSGSGSGTSQAARPR